MDRPTEKLRIAVTGGAGRIATAVIRSLLAHGHEVVALDRRQPEQALCKFHFVDLRVREYLQPIFETCNAVIHLGEIPNLDHTRSPEATYNDNTTAGGTVMQTAVDLKIRRLIYTSSCQVYGTWGWPLVAPAYLPVDEKMPLRPQNQYGCSKVANENYARMLADTTPGLSVTVIRMPWVVMENDPERMRKWLRRDPNGPGEGLGTYVHISDVARAYVAAIELAEPGWEAYHLSAAKTRLTIGLREYISRYYPDYPQLPADWPDFKSPMDCSKARQKLGWEPQWDLHERLPVDLAAAK
jgi:nucleoside-diphosphate-sugar epimerase